MIPRERMTDPRRASLATYINEGRHRIGLGRFKTYECIGREVGISEASAWRWVTEDFPMVAHEIRFGPLMRRIYTQAAAWAG